MTLEKAIKNGVEKVNKASKSGDYEALYYEVKGLKCLLDVKKVIMDNQKEKRK